MTKPSSSRSLVMVGAFPPPVHGMSSVNAAVLGQCIGIGADPVVLNTGAAGLRRDLLMRIRRGLRVVIRFMQFVAMRTAAHGTLYISISGAGGQLYEVVFLLVARLRGMRCFLHHHSFAYLARRNEVCRVLVRLAGAEATHIVLSPGMAERLAHYYPRARRIVPVSNAVLLLGQVRSETRVDSSLETIGFLSNISADKGIWSFFALVKACDEQGLAVRARIAGPFQDDATEERFWRELSAFPRVEYLGARYGKEKETFFASIDVLVFPSRYANEAEPLVIHEALMRGIPVIAYGLGAIPEILDSGAGLVIGPGTDFAPAAVSQIRVWLRSKDLYRRACASAKARYVQLAQEGGIVWTALRSEICNGLFFQPTDGHVPVEREQ